MAKILRPDAPLANPNDVEHRRQIALRANSALSKDGGNGMQVPLLLKSVLAAEITPPPTSTSVYYPPLWPGGIVYVSDIEHIAYCNGSEWKVVAATFPISQATYTGSGVIVAPADVYALKITGIAPGGGGGGLATGQGPGAGGGGGPGEVRVAYVNCSPGDSFPYAIAVAGAGAAAGNNAGTTGGDATVGIAGAILRCKGGLGGGGAVSNGLGTNGGTPTGTGGSQLMPTGLASNGADSEQGASAGGSTLYGAGGFMTSSGSVPGAPASGPGGGGGGATHGNANQPIEPGGAGFSGMVVVEHYKVY